jgi:osmotically-inducible protein OsmY
MKTLTKILTISAAAALLAVPAIPAQTGAMNEDDLRIAQQVRSQIVTLSNYGVFDSVSFSVEHGAVALNGQASRPTLKKSAERVVKKIEGVRSIENNIKVLPNSRFDDDVRARTYARIYGDASLSRYNPNRGTPFWSSPARLAAGITNDPPRGNHPIHIIVENGSVTLEGVVDTEGDKNVAGIRANGVQGAFQVVNNLTVAGMQAGSAD